MKKAMGMISVALVVVMLLSIPAWAVSILTGDSFSKTSKSNWVTDRYEPEEFDNSDNELYLAIGSRGYYRNRPADKKDKYYALQGRKLAVKKPSSTTWTATVKLNVDDTWFSSNSNKKRAEFRVDLVDGNGGKLSDSPAIALVKGGSGSPVFKFYNPKANTSWGTGNKFVNGDNETEDFYIEEGWHTLLIKSTKGVITYYVDEKKIGNCTLTTKDVYPSYMALNAYNYDRPDVINWDNCYLYDGSYIIRQLSSSASEAKEERLESQYEKKRERWYEKYTYYLIGGDWYTKSQAEKADLDIEDATSSRLTKDMPESYWDY